MLWFLLDFLPDGFIQWCIHLLVLVGLAMTIGSMFIYKLTHRWLQSIPMLAQAIKAVGILLLVLGIFLEGGYGVEMAWRAKVAEVEAKVAVAEQAAKDANTQMQAQQQAKQHEIEQITADLKKQIGSQKTVINATCKLDPIAIDLYNQAVNGGKK